MANAPYPFPYPSAAVYPHQIHHHNPLSFGFPSAYAPGPPGPVFFQPPPAQTATSAFSYAAATHSFPSPYVSTPAPFPSTFPAPPTPAPPPTGAPSLSATYQSEQSNVACYPATCYSSAATPETTHIRHPEQVPSSPLPCGCSSPTPRLLDAVLTAPNRECRPSQSHTSTPTSTPHAKSSSFPMPECGAPMAIFRTEHPTNLPTIPASSRAIAGEPAGCVVMPPSANEVRRSAEIPRVLCTGEDSDGKSGSAFHTSVSRRQPDRAPTAITDLAPLLELDDPDDASSSSGDRETNAFRRHATVAAFPEAQVRAEGSIIKNMPRAVLDLKRRLDEQQARDRNSFGSLQGELAKLMSMAAQLAVSIGKQATSATPSSSPLGVTATAYDTPKVFGEMPTPSSLLGTQATAPNIRSGHQTPIQSSCVQGGSTNLSEQNLDGMPQSYGFSNLNRQSIILADGTKHYYFTLPADYPSVQATPKISYSVVENGCITAPPSVAAQIACFAPALCSKTNNTVSSESLLVPNQQLPMNVQDASHVFKEMPVYDVCEDDATAYRNCVHPKVGISVLDNEPTVLCVNKESANVFSDGATVFPSMHVPYLFVGGSIECSHKNNKIELPSLSDSDLCCEHGKGQVHNHQWNMLLTERRDEWDPGIRKTIMDIPLVVKWSSLILWNLLLTERRDEWDPGASTYLVTPLINGSSNDIAGNEHVAYHLEQAPQPMSSSAMEHICVTTPPSVACLAPLCYSKTNNTISSEMMLIHNLRLPMTLQDYHNGLMEVHVSEELKHDNELFLKCSSKAPKTGQTSACLNYKSDLFDYTLEQQQNNDKTLVNVQQLRAPPLYVLVIDETRNACDPGIGTPSSIHLWMQGLATGIATGKALSWIPIPELTQWPSQVTSASFIWDPGTMLPQYKSICLLLIPEQWSFCFYGIALWLIHFQPP